MRRFTCLSVLVLLTVAQAVFAAPPQKISYQGELRDGGEPVADGDYTIIFRLYNVEAGGDTLWEETQSLPVVDGIFNAYLGEQNTLDLPFDETYWLGVSVEGGEEMTPRAELASSPYAYRAAVAESVVGGVGLQLPYYGSCDFLYGWAFDVENTNADGYGIQVGATWALNAVGEDIGLTASGADTGVFGGSPSGFGVYGQTNTGYGVLGEATGGGWAGYFAGKAHVAGDVGIGTETPGAKLDVNGTAQVTGLKMPTDAQDGYVLTSDASGEGTWQPPSGGLELPYEGTCDSQQPAFWVHNTHAAGYAIRATGQELGLYAEGRQGLFAYAQGTGSGVFALSHQNHGVEGHTTGEATDTTRAGVFGEFEERQMLDFVYRGYLGGANFGTKGEYLDGNYNVLSTGTLGGLSHGVYGRNDDGWAGYFDGKCYVAGDLGIGVETPSAQLDISGDIYSTGDIKIGDDTDKLTIDVATSGGGAGIATFMAQGNEPQIRLGTAGELPFIINNEKIGIGTDQPARILHVNDVMRLQPRADFPTDPGDGDLCVVGASGSRHLYCYLNGGWRQLD